MGWGIGKFIKFMINMVIFPWNMFAIETKKGQACKNGVLWSCLQIDIDLKSLHCCQYILAVYDCTDEISDLWHFDIWVIND